MIRPALMLLAVLACAAPSPAPAAEGPLPLDAFIAPDAFTDIRISPDGRHLAASVPREDSSILVMLATSDLKQVGALAFEKDVYLHDFHWASDDRLVYSVASRRGRQTKPMHTGHLYQVRIDGSDAGTVATTCAQRRPGITGTTKTECGMVVVDPLWDDAGAVLAAFGTPNGIALGEHQAGVARVRLENGRLDDLKVYTQLGNARYHVDNQGQVRMASGNFSGSRHARLDLRVGNDWVVLNDEAATGRSWRPLGFSADSRTAYLAIQEDEGPDGVYALDLQTRERTRLLADRRVDPGEVVRSPVDGALVAIRYNDGAPSFGYIDPEHWLARELQKLSKAFPGQSVWPTSYSRDGGKAVYRVGSDRNSGEFYLVDHKSGKASYIAAANEALDPARMSPMRQVTLTARDGVELDALLTVPAGRAAGQPGSMVVLVHDGPRGQADRWGFDRQVQLLASRGYAVLQPNFRGSAGRGWAFHALGDGQWTGAMLDDIVDATRWAISEGIASEGGICIQGFGYGGYAALANAAREPGLYACAIGDGGYYDLPRMFADESFGGVHRKAYLEELLGKADLEAASPVRRAADIKAPVLLGAGQYDAIAPPEHARGMQRALRAADRSVELVIYEDEDHGNFLPANRLDWARRVLAFLDANIGPGAGR